jgi:hypothetical protein
VFGPRAAGSVLTTAHKGVAGGHADSGRCHGYAPDAGPRSEDSETCEGCARTEVVKARCLFTNRGAITSSAPVNLSAGENSRKET